MDCSEDLAGAYRAGHRRWYGNSWSLSFGIPVCYRPKPKHGVALIGVFVLIVAVATIGTAIDGIFTDEDYAPMGRLSLIWRAFQRPKSVNDQQGEESDETDDESD